MTNIIFFAIFLYGVCQLLFHSYFGVETNLVWYAQTFTAILLGGGVTMFNIFDMISKLVNTSKPKEQVKSEQCFSPADYESRDFDSLVHLRNRCVAAKSQEGIDTCAKLASILFKLNIDSETGKTDDATQV